MTDHIGEGRGRLSGLEDALSEAFDPAVYGFPWYGNIDDRQVRAVRSNQAISLVDAGVAHLDALVEAERQLRELVGPNGRVMPTPDEIEARRELERVYVVITDALRAAGSLLDVLGGLTVLFLGLPVRPALADSRHLLHSEPEPAEPIPRQTEAIEDVRAAVAKAIGAGPQGWLEWTIESRNALVHRGRSLAMWAPVPVNRRRGRIVVVTKMAPPRVIRQFPHLRRQPDLSDAETALNGSQYEDLWLREPAQDTLDGVARNCAALAGAVAEVFHNLLEDLPGFDWPTERWNLLPRSERALVAATFNGFDPDSPASDLTHLVMNPRDAKRLLTMERLREDRG